MSIVSEYLDNYKEVLHKDNPGHNKSWLANEHMRKFTGWLRDRISKSLDTQTSEYLKNGLWPYIHHCDISRVRHKWIYILHQTTR
jgi:hypothetical protein